MGNTLLDATAPVEVQQHRLQLSGDVSTPQTVFELAHCAARVCGGG